MPGSAEELVELLDLEDIDVNLFRGPAARHRRCSGSSAARWPRRRWSPATRTVDPAFVVHSLHSYFLRPGDTAVPIVYDVERLRDGRSFATRRVVARQHGRPIYYLTASFQRPRRASSTRTRCPRCPRPRRARPAASCSRGRGAGGRRRRGRGSGRRSTCATSATRGHGPARATPRARRRRGCGSGSTASCADDPLQHLAAFTYASDMTLLGATLVPHGVHIAAPGHAVGLAGPHDLVPPAVPGRRVVALRPGVPLRLRRPRAGAGRVFTEDGDLVATVAQEGLVRMRG